MTRPGQLQLGRCARLSKFIQFKKAISVSSFKFLCFFSACRSAFVARHLQHMQHVASARQRERREEREGGEARERGEA